MQEELLQLFPPPAPNAAQLALARLYLQHPLHRLTEETAPLVYTNFVASLDGRIALPRPGRASHGVPPAIGNSRDWRLYQELAAQADIIITSARYFRQYARGEAQDHLPIGPGERFADLHQWRSDNGLCAQPNIAVFSASLDIPAAALQQYRERRVHVLTGDAADPARCAQLRAAGVEVHRVGSGTTVEGKRAIALLSELGYRRIYSVAGPSVLHTLLGAGVLQRMYLTFAHRIVGGEEFDTLCWGSELQPAPRAALRSLFYDPHAPENAGQLIACYDMQY